MSLHTIQIFLIFEERNKTRTNANADMGTYLCRGFSPKLVSFNAPLGCVHAHVLPICYPLECILLMHRLNCVVIDLLGLDVLIHYVLNVTHLNL